MKYLSRKEIEAIAERVNTAYMKLPEHKGKHIYKIEPELLLTKLLGLNIEHHHLSTNGTILGITSFNEIGVQVFDEEDIESYYFLDGKTVLIESELQSNIAFKGRYNFTAVHEAAHQIFKMLYPKEYGAAQNTGRLHYYKIHTEKKPIYDWEEWQANTLAAAILLPKDLILQGMFLFDLDDKIHCLNKIYNPSVYGRFVALSEFLGVSKRALAIRMKQFELLENEYLDNPYDLITIYPEVKEYADTRY